MAGAESINQTVERPDTTDEARRVAPAGRYGRPPATRSAKVRRVTLGILGVAALTAVASWYGVRNASPPITASVLGYNVGSDHSISVKFEVVKSAAKGATCLVYAPDLAGNDVGQRTVTIPPGEHTTVVTTTLRTSDRAVTGEVEQCQLTG